MLMRPARCVFAEAVCLAVMTSGCASGPLSRPSSGPIAVVAARGLKKPYPCVSLGVIASTPFHIWQDPCKARFSLFRVHDAQILGGPGDLVRRAPYKPGAAFCYVIRHERSSNIILAPGFNALALGDGAFWAEYYNLRKKNAGLDADYGAAVASVDQLKRSEGQLVVSLIPLYATEPSSGEQKILVDHSMLIFLLGLEGVWNDLRRQHEHGETRDAIALICESISSIVLAYEKKWPSYKWTGRQKRIIEWCHSIASKP
jgi:hypothetical protein